MSFGTGGLAHMTINQHNGLNGSMGLPNTGLSSRRAGVERLTISAPSPNDEVAQAPKSSRAQLLSGLRTQKNAPGSVPGTAPATQTQFPSVRKSSPPAQQNHLAVPQTATAASFAQSDNQQLNVPSVGPRGHHYTPSQVLSPPSITLENDETEGQLDPSYYQELLRMNQHLAQQQERLKQQLVAVTQQAQQMGLNPQQAQYYAQMMAQQAGLYSQMPMQMPQQPMVQPVPGQPGLFIVTDPTTGQSQYYYDQASAAQQMAFGMDASLNDQGLSHSPPPATPTFSKAFEQPVQTNNHAKSNNWRSSSPPKNSSTPPNEEPISLPPQSANAWRPGHKKTGSVMPASTTEAVPKPAPAAQGNFGGQSRDGQHPIRQPRGPPSLDEIKSKPTALHEGSKNFASRQRRAALNNIISAGAARRSYGGSNASSPTSERDELVFSSAEDNDTASIRSGNSAQRAIGSEKKEREERESRERERKNSFEAESKSVSSEEGLIDLQSKMGAVGLDNKEKRRSALQGLKGAAGQRRSIMF